MRRHDVQCRIKVALLLQDLADNRHPSGFADALDGFQLQQQFFLVSSLYSPYSCIFLLMYARYISATNSTNSLPFRDSSEDARILLQFSRSLRFSKAFSTMSFPLYPGFLRNPGKKMRLQRHLVMRWRESRGLYPPCHAVCVSGGGGGVFPLHSIYGRRGGVQLLDYGLCRDWSRIFCTWVIFQRQSSVGATACSSFSRAGG